MARIARIPFLFTVALMPILLLAGCIFPLRDLLLSQQAAIGEILASGAIYVTSPDSAEGEQQLGTTDMPITSIQSAVDVADRLIRGGRADHLEVRVSSGTYELSTPLIVAEHVMIQGGYGGVSWVLDPGTYSTIIAGSGDVVVSLDSGCAADSGIAGCSLVSGPVVESIGIESTGGTPVISNNIIDLRSAWEVTVGIYLESSNAWIDSNTILFGATSQESWGIVVIQSDPSVVNNVLAGRPGAGSRIAVHATGNSTIALLNNTIHLEGSAADIGVFLTGSIARLENNIISSEGGSYGIWEGNAPAGATTLRNNEFFRANQPIYRTSSSENLTAVADVENHVVLTLGGIASGNDAGTGAGNDPGFDDPGGLDPDFHITANPIAGRDLSVEFTTDRDGVTRTTPWSLGAYELD